MKKKILATLAFVSAAVAASISARRWFNRRRQHEAEADLRRDVARFEWEGGATATQTPASSPEAEAKMRIGIIGVGHIGGALAKLFVDAGHEVLLSNSRGPASLTQVVADLGYRARAGTSAEAAAFGDVVVVSIPFGRYAELPREGFAGKVVIDTNNYYPGRDGSFPDLDADRTTSSELLQSHLSGSRVVKAFNAIPAGQLRDGGRPAGAVGRQAIPISGDDPQAKAVVATLIGEIGFDTVDAGNLSQGGGE
jgi:predicted dinucleotide-binding enzyme